MNSVNVAYVEPDPSAQSIPLIQFWDNNIPEDVAKLIRGVADTNPEFDYLFFDDSTAAEFIRTTFGMDMLKLYRSCAIPAMRADLFRYCFLASRGGVYVDADFPAVGSMKPLLDANWVGCLYMRERGLTNSMMYFRDGGHPLAEKFLETAVYNVSNRTSNNVWQVTGPHVLKSVYADESNSSLFADIHFIEESEFARYFRLAASLDYKREDTHWLVARDKGLKIFRD